MTTLNDSSDGVRAQLFIYAKDFNDLLQQHAKLQQRHQTLLQLQGRDTHSSDLLFDLIRTSRRPLLVTDAAGTILRTNRSGRHILQGHGESPLAVNLRDRADPAHIGDLDAVLRRFALDATDEAMVLCRLRLRDADMPDVTLAYLALVTPYRGLDDTQLYWQFLDPDAGAPLDRLPPSRLLDLGSEKYAVMVTDPQARILAVSAGLCLMTDFAEEELLHQPVSVLASGRHTPEFYQSFWGRLKSLGGWTGEFLNRRRSGNIYPEWRTIKAVQDVDGRTLFFAAASRDVSDRNNNIEQLSKLAYHDALTSLPNRRLLDDRLAQAIKVARRGDEGLSLLFMDLDGFKPVNDRYGHAVGDQVLQQVATRLEKALRGGDTVARIGGDEFVILLPELSRIADIEEVARKLLSRLSMPIAVGDLRIFIGASVGCARYPADGDDGDTLIRNADAAMYHAKQQGGNQVGFLGTGALAQSRPTLGLDVWGAAERGEMRLVYQPQVHAADPRRLRGCEALLRWQHPVHGTIPPDVFISAAENNGAILPLGLWVLTSACRQARAWQDAGLDGLVMSVNVSYRQMQDTAFASSVRSVLEQTGLAPEHLELEITETATGMLETDHFEQLQSLRQLGVKIAIDDFGIGYSSLKRLSTLRADTLKIDREFTRGIASSREALALCQCVLSIGHALGMAVIAEGIEEGAQIEVLARQGCELLQGYHVSRPLEAEAVLGWARQQTARAVT